MSKKRKSGDPRNRAGGRVSAGGKTCRINPGRPCHRTTKVTSGDGVTVMVCSRCGSTEPGVVLPDMVGQGPEREPVPADWFN